MTGSAPIVIVDYDPGWPARFEAVRGLLLERLQTLRPHIEHIGSTAVPGLAAKPIVDILLGCARLADFEAHIPGLETAGWQYHPEHEAELPERRFLTWPRAQPRSLHLHATVRGNAFWTQHLRFRDALRARPDVAAAYAELKRDLASRFAEDREAYTRAKTGFVESVLAS